MFRKKPKPHSLPTMSDKMLATVGDWLGHLGSVPDEFDAVQYQAVVNDIMRAMVAHGDIIRQPEGRTAMVKVLAASLCMAVYDGTDEDVYKIMDGVRGDLYAEVMKFRRAVARDVRGEVHTDG